jgi:hypothetical protein
MVEGKARCISNTDKAFSQPLLLKLECPIVTVGIIAWAAKEDMAGPCAPSPTDLGIIAAATKTPEVLNRTVLENAERGCTEQLT